MSKRPKFCHCSKFSSQVPNPKSCIGAPESNDEYIQWISPYHSQYHYQENVSVFVCYNFLYHKVKRGRLYLGPTCIGDSIYRPIGSKFSSYFDHLQNQFLPKMKCGAANVGRLNKLRWCEHHHNLCHNRDDHNDIFANAQGDSPVQRNGAFSPSGARVAWAPPQRR